MSIESHPLYKEFYRWEQLGRGELLWNQAVQPEPFFHPFEAHGVFHDNPPKPITDDGLVPSPFTRLKRKISQIGKPKPTPPEHHDPLEYLEHREAPEYCLDHRTEFVEFVLLIPNKQKIEPSKFEHFLFALTPASFPIGFEIIASTDQIIIQLVTDQSDQILVTNCLEAYLPEVGVEIHPSVLPDLMLELCDHAIISRELALQHEFIFPIATGNNRSMDPYQNILSSLSNLQGDEVAIVQFNFQPCVNPWARSIWKLVTQNDGKTPFFEDGDTYLKAVQDKNRKPLIATTLRLAILAPSEDEARYVARQLAGSFQTFEGQNGFVLADDDGTDHITRKVELALRRFRRSGMILNTDEFLSLVHLPDSQINAPKLLRLAERTSPAPSANNTIDHTPDHLILGFNPHKSESLSVSLTSVERSRHIHIMGASGTGKSTLLLNSIIQDLENGHGLALLDPHGDLVDDVLNYLPKHRIKDVVMFDPADEEFPVGFNMLSAKSEVEKNLLASDLVATFQRLASAWGDQMTAVLGNAVMAFLDSSTGGTLPQLRRFLVEKSYRFEFLQSVTDQEVLYFWHEEFPLLKGNTQASLVTRLNSFLRQRLIRNMVAQDGNKLDFANVMDTGKIFLAPLSQGLIGEENSWLLGSLLVSKFYQTALSRQSTDETDRRPFWLYIDEAHNFVTPSIASILSGTRKYGMGMVLAHHSLEQFSRTNPTVLSSLLTNAHTRICFRLGDSDARKFDEGFDHFDANDIRKLSIGKAIARIGGSQNDFNLTTPLPPEAAADSEHNRKQAIGYSRNTYGTPKKEVEDSLGSYTPRKQTLCKKTTKTTTPTQKTKTPPPEEPTIRDSDLKTKKPQVKEKPPVEPLVSSHDEKLPESTKPPRDTKDTPPTSVSESPSKAPGRGGEKHKHLQHMIKQHANGIGLRATIEKTLPNGEGSVDVMLEGQTQKIAIEVALQSPIEQEVRNIEKSISFGCNEIVVISESTKHLANIDNAASEQNIPLQSVRFIRADQIADYFAELGANLASSETESMGYKVKSVYSAKSAKESATRANALNKAVADSIRKLREKGKGHG